MSTPILVVSSKTADAMNEAGRKESGPYGEKSTSRAKPFAAAASLNARAMFDPRYAFDNRFAPSSLRFRTEKTISPVPAFTISMSLYPNLSA